MQSPRIIALAPSVVACLVLAACGSSNSKTASSGTNLGIRFSDCMRANGVPNFPDQPSGGGGVKIPDGSGINPQSPAFQSALNKCQKLLPGGGPLHGGSSEKRREQLLKLAECMRAHGISSFPDPTATAPSPGNFRSANGSRAGIAFGAPGAFIAVPATMMQSPAFQQAAGACGFPGGGRLPKGKALAFP